MAIRTNSGSGEVPNSLKLISRPPPQLLMRPLVRTHDTTLYFYLKCSNRTPPSRTPIARLADRLPPRSGLQRGVAGPIQSITAIKIKCKWRYERATRVLCKFGSPVITEWKLMSSSDANGPGKCKKRRTERERENNGAKCIATRTYVRMSVSVRDNESKRRGMSSLRGLHSRVQLTSIV